MNRRAALFFTSLATHPPLIAIARELMPEVDFTVLIEDSMINDIRRAGGADDDVARRIVHYVKAAQLAGCDAFMTTCSTIGEIVEDQQRHTTMRLLRIDTAMATEAAQLGSHITVVATTATTVEPTQRLVQRAADAVGAPVTIRTHLVDDAYDLLLAGDRAGHDRLLLHSLQDACVGTDVVVMAQASMEALVDDAGPFAVPVLTSPRSGLTQLRDVLATLDED